MSAYHRLLFTSLLFATVIASLLSTGCDKSKSSPPHHETNTSNQEKADKALDKEYYYSSAYLSLKGEPPFNTITFKDVGVEGLTTDNRSVFFSQLAEQLAADLDEKKKSLNIQSVTSGNEPKFADPSFHLACGSHHIYIDLWRNRERTGYSMWSGCGEEDNFAWIEALNPTPSEAIKTLSQRLTTTLENAIKSNCFQKDCSPLKK